LTVQNKSASRRDLARRYLSPMGIQAWELRGNKTAEQSAAIAKPATQPTVTGRDSNHVPDPLKPAPASARTAMASLQPGALSGWCDTTRLVMLQAGTLPVLGLVLESDEFPAPAADLLQAMLSAIQLPMEQQQILRTDDQGQTLDQMQPEQQPGCYLLMPRLPDPQQPDALAALRAANSCTWRGIPLRVSLHPTDLLLNPQAKRPAWEDLKALRVLLDKSI